jgi:hypothetical protein
MGRQLDMFGQTKGQEKENGPIVDSREKALILVDKIERKLDLALFLLHVTKRGDSSEGRGCT